MGPRPSRSSLRTKSKRWPCVAALLACPAPPPPPRLPSLEPSAVSQVITFGSSKQSRREWKVWDPRNPSKHLSKVRRPSSIPFVPLAPTCRGPALWLPRLLQSPHVARYGTRNVPAGEDRPGFGHVFALLRRWHQPDLPSWEGRLLPVPLEFARVVGTDFHARRIRVVCSPHLRADRATAPFAPLKSSPRLRGSRCATISVCRAIRRRVSA